MQTLRAALVRHETEFRERDGTEADLRGSVGNEIRSGVPLPAENEAHRVRVEHELGVAHSNGSRIAWSGSSFGRGMEPRQAPMHERKSEGQTSTGSKTTLLPTLRTTTSRWSSGKR